LVAGDVIIIGEGTHVQREFSAVLAVEPLVLQRMVQLRVAHCCNSSRRFGDLHVRGSDFISEMWQRVDEMYQHVKEMY